MRIFDSIKTKAAEEESYFRQYLAKEDLGRIERLELLAKSASDKASFLKDGQYIGWTRDDMRTHDLKDTLEPLLEAFYTAVKTPGKDADDRLEAAWDTFNKDRLEKLIHCL